MPSKPFLRKHNALNRHIVLGTQKVRSLGTGQKHTNQRFSYSGVLAHNILLAERNKVPAHYALRNTHGIDRISLREMTAHLSGKRMPKAIAKKIARFMASNKITNTKGFADKLSSGFKELQTNLERIWINSVVEAQLGGPDLELYPKPTSTNIEVVSLDSKGRVIFFWSGKTEKKSYSGK